MYIVKQPVVGKVLEFKVNTLDEAVSKMKTIDGRSCVESIEDSDSAIARKYDGIREEFRLSLHCLDMNNGLTEYFNEKIAEDHEIDTVVYDRDGDLTYAEFRDYIKAIDSRVTFKIDDITDTKNLIESIKEDLAGSKYNPVDVLFGYTDDKGEFNCMYNIYKDFRENSECFFMIFGKLTDEVKTVLNSFNNWGN